MHVLKLVKAHVFYCLCKCEYQSWIYIAQNHEASLLRLSCLIGLTRKLFRFKLFPKSVRTQVLDHGNDPEESSKK